MEVVEGRVSLILSLDLSHCLPSDSFTSRSGDAEDHGNHFWRIMGTYKYTEEYDAYIQVYRVIVFFPERQLTLLLFSDGVGVGWG